MKRRVVAILVVLSVFASLVFASSGGASLRPAEQSYARTDDKIPTSNTSLNDYIYMKSDEGWQMELDGRKIMVVVGNFAAHHDGTVITADSAVRYSERHIECFGNVLINRGSTYIYADRAEYNGDTHEAEAFSKIVKVVDGEATLFTYNFLFNTKSNIGRFSGGGVLVSGDNLLEADRGFLYSDTHEVIGVERVQMRNNEYDMTSDSVVYNTETNYAEFYSRTNIWNKNGSDKEDDYLYTDKGSFDKNKQLYKLVKKGYILTEDQELLCDSLDYYRDSNYVVLKRNIQIDDRSQKLLLFGDWGEYWKEPGNVFVTKDPSIINYDTSESDSVFMCADSMYLYTHYPIREKIEQARRDSLEQAAKLAAADTVKTKESDKGAAEEVGKPKKTPKANKEQANRNDAGRREEMLRKQEDVARRREERMAAQGGKEESLPSKDSPRHKVDTLMSKSDTTRVVTDSVKVANDSIVVARPKTKSELRIEMIDSLANDSTVQGRNLRAKLIKELAVELYNIVKAAIKRAEEEKLAERKAVLAERHALYVKVLGEARVRDAERMRIEKERAKQVKDSLKVVQDSIKRAERIAAHLAKKKGAKVDSVKVDSVKVDSVKTDSIKLDTIKVDAPKIDSVKVEVAKVDSTKVETSKVDSVKLEITKTDSLKVDIPATDSLKLDVPKTDSLKVDSVQVNPLAKFDTMTVKQVKAHFKAIYDAEKAEEERIKQDSLNAKLDRIGRERQAKRAEQYRKWAIRDSIYLAKEQERADMQLRRKLLRMEKRGIYIQMADAATLAKVDSVLLSEFSPLDTVVHRQLDSLIEVLFPKDLPSPTAVAKADSMNIDSMYREIIAIRRVKMFRSDAQSICDSLITSTVDSIIHMHKSPVMWNGSNQITSEEMHIITRNSAIAQANFNGKPMMVAEIDTAHYNQVAGKEMQSLFRNGEVYRNDVNGNVQTIYYMQEDNSPEITLMAYIEAGDMTSYIENQQVVGITYRGNPVYTFYPMNKIPETQPTKLDGFKWEADRRPTQDSVFTRTIRPSQREEKRSLRKPLFPINALLQQRKSDYLRRREWRDRTDTLTYETIEWLESLPVNYRKK